MIDSTESGALTLIIPIRTDNFDFYERRLALRDTFDLDGIRTMIVDDGSPEHQGNLIRDFCKHRGYSYIRIDTQDPLFNLSRARNEGIKHADTEWICFEDADLTYASDFHRKLLGELLALDSTPFNFITVPVAYLTEAASARLFEAGETHDQTVREIANIGLLECPLPDNANETIASYAPASSVLALRRKTAMLVGAFDCDFKGWGGEDRDFVFRLLQFNSLLDKPPAFSETKPWNLNQTFHYEGWRALYRLHGDFAAHKGLYGYHLYHPPLAWRDGTSRNIRFAAAKAAEIANSGKIFPVADGSKPLTVLIGNNPHLANAQVLGLLENPVIELEEHQQNPERYAQRIVEMQPNQVMFWNPYGHSWRLELYRYLRAHSVRTIVAERGALPRTIYFDEGGLCIESNSYEQARWNHPLSLEREMRVRKYLEELRFGTEALEKQSERIGSGLLRLRLGLDSSRIKILFVPLQLAQDTVTTYFSEDGRTYQDYLTELRRLSLRLPADWVMAIKNHPLATEQVNWPSTLNVDHYHINDLLEVCEAVALFNSGVGTLSMAFGKYTFCYGRAFYGISDVNEAFRSADQVAETLAKLPSVNSEKVRRFYSYLIEDFYSFADMEGDVVEGGSRRKFSLRKIHYDVIRLPGQSEHRYQRRKFQLENSILFDRYRGRVVGSAGADALHQKMLVAPALRASTKRQAVLRPAIRLIGNASDNRKFDQNPAAWFSDLRSPLLRGFGRLVFGAPAELSWKRSRRL